MCMKKYLLQGGVMFLPIQGADGEAVLVIVSLVRYTVIVLLYNSQT